MGGGVPCQTDKKNTLTALFVFCFFSKFSSYFTEVKWLISKKNIIFQGFGEGPNFSRGSNFFFFFFFLGGGGGLIAYSL